MRRLSAAVLAAAPLGVYAAVGAAWRNRPLFYALVAEDRWFEMLQVAGYGVAAAGFATLAVLLWRPSRAGALAAAGGALLFAIVVGEELSWGQRHWDVRLAAVERVNDQGDLTLHNVGAGLELSQAGLLGVALAGAATPFLHRVEAATSRLPTLARFRPPVWVAGWFGAAAAFTAARLTVLRAPPFNVAKLSEVAELSVAAGAAVVAGLAVREALDRRRRDGAGLNRAHRPRARSSRASDEAAPPDGRRPGPPGGPARAQPEAAAQTPHGGAAPE